jgi:hypothetical protein
MKKLSLLLAAAILVTSCTDHDVDSNDIQKESDAIKNPVTVTYRDALSAMSLMMFIPAYFRQLN